MEIKIINESDFNSLTNRGHRNTTQEGKPDGDYEELLSFLSWTLESNYNNNSINLKDAINILSKKFGISATTEFLKNQMRRRGKTARINYLLKNVELTTTPINRYYYSVVNAKMRLHQFGTERSYEVGHTYKKTNRETFNLIVEKQQQEKRMAEIKSNFEEMEKLEKKRPLKKPEKPEAPKPEVEIDYPGIEVNCKKCNKTIKLPLTPNYESDKEESLMCGIYSCLINGIEEGKRFCSRCQAEIEKEGLWKIQEMTKWLQENKGSCFEFSTEDFCQDFRNDKKNVSGTTIKAKLESIMPVECKLNQDKVKLLVKE